MRAESSLHSPNAAASIFVKITLKRSTGEREWERDIELRARVAEVDDEFLRQFWNTAVRGREQAFSELLPPFFCGLALEIFLGLVTAAAVIW